MPAHVLIYLDERMTQHKPGRGHPERPQRLQAIMKELGRLESSRLQIVKPNAATQDALERVHDADYVAQINSLRGQTAQLDSDTVVSPASVEAAYLACGAAVDAVDAVIHGDARRAFAIVRPPGHHAESNRAMGFCLFNNIAIAAAHAIAAQGCKRVLIVDWDVHHGNGTQHIFQSRRDVLFFSAHQWPLYPGTGALEEVGVGDGVGYTVNAPLPAGPGDADYVALFRQLLIPVAAAYQPDLILVSAGFDAHRDDPLGGMNVTQEGFAALSAMVCDMADRHANGRLVLLLEGGYQLRALAASVRSCIEVLAGGVPPELNADAPSNQNVISKLCGFHQQFWPTLNASNGLS